MSIIKEIGVLGFGQLFQKPLVVFGSQLNSFIKLILGRTGNFLFFNLVGYRPVRRKNASPMDRFQGF